MKRLVLALSFGLALLISVSARADHLEVRRDATLKQAPIRHAATLIRPEIGSKLQVLDGGRQTQGYYRAYDPKSDQTGWIYRTLVRRYPGDLAAWQARSAGPLLDPSAYSSASLIAHFVDVGQGDAAILEFPCGLVMIDAGAGSEADAAHLTGYLARIFDRRADLEDRIAALFVTHTHIDHNRALRDVAGRFRVERYIHNGVYDGSGRHAARWMRDEIENGAPIEQQIVTQTMIAGLETREGFTSEVVDPLSCDGVDPEIRVLSGPYEDNPGWPSGAFENGNNRGISIRVEFGRAALLFTGDMEEHALDTFVEFYEGAPLLDVDLYQVGHHASHNATTEALMQAMTPDIAVMSHGGIENRDCIFCAWAYGHPREDTVALLDLWIERRRRAPVEGLVASGGRTFHSLRMEDAILSTAWDGDIVVVATADGGFMMNH